MDSKDASTFITPHNFNAFLEAYPSVVPEKLSQLDEQRYDAIPRLLRDRNPPTFLTKAELATLVDWKLSHGKFRPTLKGLVQQNDDSTVQEDTSVAFDAWNSSKKGAEDAKRALDTLTKLKGVGPATASLLLSVDDPEVAPFFSDELFRWSMFEDGKGQGWDREIKYTMKEYRELLASVSTFRSRVLMEFERDVKAVEMEKVAYVLGKRAAGMAEDGGKIQGGATHTKKRKADIEPQKDARSTKKPASNDVGSTKPKARPNKSTSAPSTAASGRPKRTLK